MRTCTCRPGTGAWQCSIENLTQAALYVTQAALYLAALYLTRAALSETGAFRRNFAQLLAMPTCIGSDGESIVTDGAYNGGVCVSRDVTTISSVGEREGGHGCRQ